MLHMWRGIDGLCLREGPSLSLSLCPAPPFHEKDVDTRAGSGKIRSNSGLVQPPLSLSLALRPLE